MNSTQPAQTSIIKTQKEPAKEIEVRKVQDILEQTKFQGQKSVRMAG